jgi:hypothetical protein
MPPLRFEAVSRNPNTRKACFAAAQFSAWSEDKGLPDLARIELVHVAGYTCPPAAADPARAPALLNRSRRFIWKASICPKVQLATAVLPLYSSDRYKKLIWNGAPRRGFQLGRVGHSGS